MRSIVFYPCLFDPSPLWLLSLLLPTSTIFKKVIIVETDGTSLLLDAQKTRYLARELFFGHRSMELPCERSNNPTSSV